MQHNPEKKIFKKFSVLHSALKLEKKCNFKSTKTHFLHFQKWHKINFSTRKKSENGIFDSFKLFSCAKNDFLPFLKMQIICFCTFEITLFSNFREPWSTSTFQDRILIFFDNYPPNNQSNMVKNFKKILLPLLFTKSFRPLWSSLWSFEA